jgi:hypothetical protein
MFKYFKRRWSDIGSILTDLYSGITWLNCIWFLPGAIVLTFFIVFIMQFEDYDEIDQWDNYMEDRLRGRRVS